MFWVYVLTNSQNGKKYIGQTSDLELRLQRHNGLLPSKKKSFTSLNKAGGTWIITYKEEYKTRQETLKREKYLKSHAGRDWLGEIISGR
ncbi:hypothetical protein A2690_03205 [Candidatus Roizmanbacteria bacterium RIFCSPHIGHO2_01_FULL_39_12b]|uniref:GIY-YIG domain-containing protein n=1 Tax=Candidatus Roizmanbacteria bacterium RIFCSPHIGHO2_01_FULL_39_12b TaxID=1802030 RepID=A0A1F7GBD3_9BACT|nr:MAG: hypothetical protein A2690_03205 [Candidatus Roizmanbacteria bacterium RIFCSPHIGHO2_01_FULL_39_12b]